MLGGTLCIFQQIMSGFALANSKCNSTLPRFDSTLQQNSGQTVNPCGAAALQCLSLLQPGGGTPWGYAEGPGPNWRKTCQG